MVQSQQLTSLLASFQPIPVDNTGVLDKHQFLLLKQDLFLQGTRMRVHKGVNSNRCKARTGEDHHWGTTLSFSKDTPNEQLQLLHSEAVALSWESIHLGFGTGRIKQDTEFL